MRLRLLILVMIIFCCIAQSDAQVGGPGVGAHQGVIGGGTGGATGPAGGDLSGTYPNPTVFQAGGGTGNFQAGSVGVGIAADSVLGDILSQDGIAIGPNSTAISPGAGAIVMDSGITCNNTGTIPATCLTINSSSTLVPVFGLDAGNNFLFGGVSGFGQIFQSSVGTSQTFKINTTNIMQIQAAGITTGLTFTDADNSGSAVKLTSGAVLTMTGGSLPTLTVCNGAGSSVTAGSTPNRGQFATQTAGCSTATVHFTQTMPQKMFCVCGDGNASITPVACSYDFASSSTTQAVFDFANAGASYKYDYVCE